MAKKRKKSLKQLRVAETLSKADRQRLLSLLKKEADKALSLYVRAVYRAKYGDKCPLCGEGQIQCCFHVIRAKWCPATRWDIRNLLGTCHKCNWLEYRNPDLSRAWFVRTFGADLYLALVEQSSKRFEPTVEFLETVVTNYTELLRRLKEGKGGDPDAAANTPDRQFGS